MFVYFLSPFSETVLICFTIKTPLFFLIILTELDSSAKLIVCKM